MKTSWWGLIVLIKRNKNQKKKKTYSKAFFKRCKKQKRAITWNVWMFALRKTSNIATQVTKENKIKDLQVQKRRRHWISVQCVWFKILCNRTFPPYHPWTHSAFISLILLMSPVSSKFIEKHLSMRIMLEMWYKYHKYVLRAYNLKKGMRTLQSK